MPNNESSFPKAVHVAVLAGMLATGFLAAPSGGTPPKPAGAADPAAAKAPSGGAVRGRLVDAETGRGVSGGVVLVFAEESEEDELSRRAPDGALRRPLAETKAAADGRFELRLPSRDGFYDLEAQAPGRARSQVASGLDGARAEQGLTMSRLSAGGTLSGVVRDGEGKPLAGARVLFVPSEASSRGRIFPRGGGASRPASLQVETGEDGAFRLDGVPATGGMLAARAPGFAPVRRRGVRPAAGIDLRLVPGVAVEGKVRDAAGQGVVPGARVGWSDDPFGTIVAAATDGSFRIADLPEGTVTLRAFSPRTVVAEWTGRIPVAPEGTAPLFRLRPGGALQVEARGRDGRPVPRARVEVRSAASGDVRRGRTGSRGELLLGGFGSHSLMVGASGAGWLQATAEGILLRGGETRRLPLLLEREATVAGLVVDEKGEPVAGAVVTAETDLVPGVRRFAGRIARMREEEREAETDSAGRFRIDGLSARSFVLAAVAAGRARSDLPIPRLSAGENRTGIRLVVDFGGLASGRVVDGDGNPLEGVRVGAFEFNEARAFLPPGTGEEEPLAEGTTGTDGEYLLAGLPVGAIAVDARRSGLARGSSPRVSVRPAETTRVPDIVLRPGAAIVGKVVDRSGAPVPDATVLSFRPPFSLGSETTTDAEGAFRVDDLDASAAWTLFVRSPDKGGAEKGGITPGGEPVEIRLAADGRIAGRVVVKGSGEPVPTFVARWSPAERPGGRRGFAAGFGGGEPKAFSSEAGTFELTGVEPGNVEVRVEAAGFRPSAPVPVVVPDDPAAPPAEVAVELDRGLMLGGRVLDANRAPAAGVPVSPGGGGGGFARAFRGSGGGTVTDADGRFRLEGLEKGTVTIVAEPEGRPASSKTVELAADRDDVEILLGTGARVTGEVRRRDGSPAAGAEVSLTPGGSGSRGFFDARQETTDAAGAFVFTGVADGAWELRASLRTGAATAPAPLVVAGADPAPVRLEFVPGARVDVRVSGLSPDLLRRLDVRGVVQGEVVPAQNAGEGSWFLEDVPPGELTIVAQTEPGLGGRRVSKSVDLPEGGAGLAVDLEFPAGARLSGRILRRGEPMAGVVVSATAGDGGGVSGETTNSDASGNYALEGLADGPWSVIAFDLRTGLRLSEEVEIRGDTRRDLEFPAGTAAGRVVHAGSGAPVPKARVTARPAEGGGGRFFGAEETGVDGRFSFEDVPDGELDLTAEAPGFSSARRRVRIADGSPAGGEVEMALAPEAALRLRVRLTTGGVASRARVLVVDPATGSAVPSDLVAEDGVFRVPGLAAGTTTLVVESSGMAPTTLPAVAVPGETEVLLGPGGFVELVSGGDGERTCRLLRADGGVEWVRSDDRGSLRPFQSVAPPGVRLGPIAPGAWKLELVDAASGARELRDVVVTAGATTTVEWP